MKRVSLTLLAIFSLKCQADYTCRIIKPDSTLQLPGTVQWQSETPTEWYTLSAPAQASCSGSGPLKLVYTASSTLSGEHVFNGVSYSMFSTSVPGIKYIMEYINWNKSKTWQPVVRSNFTGWQTGTGTGWTLGTDLRIKFVRDTGARPKGSLQVPPFSIATATISSDVSSWPAINLNASGTTIEAKSKSCSLKSPGTIRLPKSYLSDLREIGASSGNSPFSFSVDCSDSFSKYSVSYYMTDAFSFSNKSSTLTLSTDSGSAKGVGIQVLNGDTPIIFGPEPTVANTQLIGTLPSAGGGLTKFLSASYIRTNSETTPGSVSAGLTLTLIYD